MLSIVFIFIYLLSTVVGIYLFDFRVDGVINDFLGTFYGVLFGILILLSVIIFYIEGLYLIIGKTRPQTDMLKHKLAKQIMGIPLYFTNTRMKVIGKENLPKDPSFTIYSNHTSLMDIPLLMNRLYEYPVGFLAKKVVADLFRIGKWTPVLGCVSIDRSNDRKAAESIIKVIKNVKDGSTMVIFPEGTRSKHIGELLEFKPGSFRVALKTKAPLVPVSIVKPSNFKKVKWPFPKRVTVVIHKPIPYEEIRLLKTQELAEKVKEIIKEPLDKIY